MHRAGLSVKPVQDLKSGNPKPQEKSTLPTHIDQLKELREALKANLEGFEHHSRDELSKIPASPGEIAKYASTYGVDCLVDLLTNFIKHYSSEARRSVQANRHILNEMKLHMLKLNTQDRTRTHQEVTTLIQKECSVMETTLQSEINSKVHKLEQKASKLEQNLRDLKPKPCLNCPNFKVEVVSLQSLLESNTKEIQMLRSKLEEESAASSQHRKAAEELRSLLEATKTKSAATIQSLENQLSGHRQESETLRAHESTLSKESQALQDELAQLKSVISANLLVSEKEVTPQLVEATMTAARSKSLALERERQDLSQRIEMMERKQSQPVLRYDFQARLAAEKKNLTRLAQQMELKFRAKVGEMEANLMKLATLVLAQRKLVAHRPPKPIRLFAYHMEPVEIIGLSDVSPKIDSGQEQKASPDLSTAVPMKAQNDRFNFNLDDLHTFSSLLQNEHVFPGVLPSIEENDESMADSPVAKTPMSSQVQRLAELLCLTPANLLIMKVKDLVTLIEARLQPLSKLDELQEQLQRLQHQVAQLEQDLRAKVAEVERLRGRSHSKQTRQSESPRKGLSHTPVSLQELRKSTSAGNLGLTSSQVASTAHLKKLYVQQSVAAKQLQLLLFVAHKEALAEKSRAERFFREANRMRNELEAINVAQNKVIEENEALLSENTRLKISIENLGKGKPAAKLTQEFNSLMLDKDVQLSQLQQRLKTSERRENLKSEEAAKLGARCSKLTKIKDSLTKLVRLVMGQVPGKLKTHVFELLDQIEAHNQVDETITCIMQCMEEMKIDILLSRRVLEEPEHLPQHPSHKQPPGHLRLLSEMVRELEQLRTQESKASARIRHLVEAVERNDLDDTVQALAQVIRVVYAAEEHQTRRILQRLCEMAIEIGEELSIEAG